MRKEAEIRTTDEDGDPIYFNAKIEGEHVVLWSTWGASPFELDTREVDAEHGEGKLTQTIVPLAVLLKLFSGHPELLEQLARNVISTWAHLQPFQSPTWPPFKKHETAMAELVAFFADDSLRIDPPCAGCGVAEGEPCEPECESEATPTVWAWDSASVLSRLGVKLGRNVRPYEIEYAVRNGLIRRPSVVAGRREWDAEAERQALSYLKERKAKAEEAKVEKAEKAEKAEGKRTKARKKTKFRSIYNLAKFTGSDEEINNLVNEENEPNEPNEGTTPW